MAKIFIDNRPFEADASRNLLDACLSLGINIPHFCWHPALHSVGACRLCAVKQFKDENDKRGKIVMSCMTPVTEGMRISITDPAVLKFRKSVIEWLMINHPHDCPVCDEGGHCHLQDMTIMTGHDYRRYRFKKRTYRNQNLGPFIHHEMNRCIQCYRCVRFYRDYAGGRDFDVFGARNILYYGRYQDGRLESEFSGNLVEVCPTGVFTDKTQKKHYTRKWDMQFGPSLCPHCSLGCNTQVFSRYGEDRGVVNRYHPEINGYFLCDRGRFSYEYSNAPERIRKSRFPSQFTEDEALADLSSLLLRKGKVIGVGSPRASLEANHALRQIVGSDRFSTGMSKEQARLVSLIVDIQKALPGASLSDIEKADAVLILGENITDTAPRAALSVRQSILQKPMAISDNMKIPRWHQEAVRTAIGTERGPLFIACPYTDKLEEVATRSVHLTPEGIAKLGWEIGEAIEKSSQKTDMRLLSVSAKELQPDKRPDGLAMIISDALLSANNPVIISGPLSESVLKAAAQVVRALRARQIDAKIFLTAPEVNSVGVSLMGGMSLEDVHDTLKSGKADTLFILENDIFSRVLFAADLLSTAQQIVSIHYAENRTTAASHYVLASAPFSQSDGTFVNQSGHAQQMVNNRLPLTGTKESWRWLMYLAALIEHPVVNSWKTFPDITRSLSSEPAFKSLADAAPVSGSPITGQPVARQPHRYSGRTAMTADKNIHEPQTPSDRDSPFAFSMEGYQGIPPSNYVPFFWAPGWNSPQAAMKYQRKINGSLLSGNPGVRLWSVNEGAWDDLKDQSTGTSELEKNEFLVIVWHEFFGYDELSLLSKPIQEALAEPMAAMASEDAKKLGVSEGQKIALELSDEELILPVTLKVEVPRGAVGIPSRILRTKAFSEAVKIFKADE